LPKLFTKLSRTSPADARAGFHVRFYPFVSISNTIRLREGEIYIRLSDLLEGSPDAYCTRSCTFCSQVQPVERRTRRYRRYIASHTMTAKARLGAQMRGRKHIPLGAGHHYTWKKSSTISTGAFSRTARPPATYLSQNRARAAWPLRPAHNAIVISRVFDDPRCRDMRSNTSCITRCCI